jgi:hypothetical protein
MGSFHTVVVMVPCPRCGDRHYLCHQTKFFDSDYPRQDLRVGRSFEVGETLAELDVSDAWEGEWMRLSDGPLDPARLVVLDEVRGCDCGTSLAMMLVYDVRTLAGHRATLSGVELRPFDASDLLERVDFVDWFDVVAAPSEAPFAPTEADAARRRAHVARALHDASLKWDPPLEPVRCAHCGTTAQRTTARRMAGFDPRERGGLAGELHRLREPGVGAPLVVAGAQRSTGCGCGAGSMMHVTTYEPDGASYRRVRTERRHVNGVADLEDAHFAWASGAIGHPHERSWVEHGLRAISTRLRL